jgi:hypothetical protein
MWSDFCAGRNVDGEVIPIRSTTATPGGGV